MTLDDLITMKALEFKAQMEGPASLVDQAAAAGHPAIRQFGISVSSELFDAIENVCQTLNVSKRQFGEACLAEAVLKCEQAISAVVAEVQERRAA
jgi:hypothetical protein